MDPAALRHPRGPLPASTYWRRRVVLLLVVLALAYLIARACGGGSGSQAAGPAATPSAASSAAAPAAPSATAPARASATPAAAPTCADGDLTVTAVTDAPVYADGQLPHLQMKVTNTSARTCRRALGKGSRELKVVSGADRIWSSDDCASGGATGEQTLRPGKTAVFAVVWDRHRSTPGCAGPGDAARHGTYRLYARVGSLTSGAAVFALH